MANNPHPWKVQVRIDRNHAWRDDWAYTTREEAREDGRSLRGFYGFGNTRVLKK